MNQEIAKIFREMAFILEAQNVAFKPRAYERSAEVLETLTGDVEDLYNKGGLKFLQQIPSIGKALAEHIEEYIKTKKIKEYQTLKKQLPVDISGLSAIEGLGPKKIKELYLKLKIKNVADLEKAISLGKIAKLENFGKKSEENITRGLSFAKTATTRIPLGYILPLAQSIVDKLKKVPGVKNVVLAGSIRRYQETIGDIDILVLSDSPQKIMDVFVNLPEVDKILGQGLTKSTVHLKTGMDADLRVVAPEVFGAALQYFTGDKNHNVKVREIAISKGYKLSEYGLFKKDKIIACKTEEEIYNKLGMDYIPPEIRTDSGEIEAAIKHKLPKLISYGSLKGDLQTTTNWTDGETSIKEMAEAAVELGLEYIAITDHTQALAIAHGLNEKMLMRQAKEIDKINLQYQKDSKNFRILKSAEININKDGTLDINDETLKKLEIVSVAVHSSFRMSKVEMTKRILRAIENPYVNILFHPTGRLINKREAYEVDMDAIILAAKKNNVALELDCFPDRMDLKDVYVRKAVEAGVKIAIDTDSHSPDHLKFLEFGIGTARRAWVTKKDVINTWPVEKLLKWCSKK